jgi:hypothetical protein
MKLIYKEYNDFVLSKELQLMDRYNAINFPLTAEGVYYRVKCLILELERRNNNDLMKRQEGTLVS